MSYSLTQMRNRSLRI